MLDPTPPPTHVTARSRCTRSLWALVVATTSALVLLALPGAAQASLAVTVDGGGTEYVVADAAEDLEPQAIGSVHEVDLVSPSPLALLAGFHQATVGGTEPLTPIEAGDGDPTAVDVLASRGRGTHPTSAVDVAVPEDEPVLAAVDGEIRAVSSYQLYGTTSDIIVVIVPTDAPELEVQMLHLEDPQVEVGETVVAGETVIASRARTLPFPSQIDGVIGEVLPHVHIEVLARG